MASLMSAKLASTMPLRPVVARPARQLCRKVVLCKAEQQSSIQKLALPVATASLALMLSGAYFPDDAMAARSGGRAGGSSGFSSRRAPVTQAAPSTTSRTTIVQNTYVAPPVYGGYGYSPFGGFGGISFMPTFFVPVGLGGLSSIFGIFFLMAMLSVVFSVVKGMSSGSDTKDSSSKKFDSWDD